MDPYKNASGRYLLRQIFYENDSADKTGVIYTLKDQDHLSYPSLYRLYMEETDPTEYAFATKHLGGWRHWTELSQCEWFKPYVDRWREEFAIRVKALALMEIQAIATSGSPAKLAANKLLLDGGWQSKPKARVGRPEKEKIIAKAEDLSKDELTLLDFRNL